MPRRTPKGAGGSGLLLVDRMGARHGRLVVIAQAQSDRYGARWLCRCDCGGAVVVAARTLRDGE